MNDEAKDLTKYGILFIGIVIVFTGSMCGMGTVYTMFIMFCGDPIPQSQLIEQGSAYYHPETGEFTLKSGNILLKEVNK